MTELSYAKPDTIDDTCSLLAEYGDSAAILSGGQSLLPMLRQRITDYEYIIDINGISELSYIKEEAGNLLVGGLARHSEIASSNIVKETCPVVAEVAGEIGDVQVRNRGTFCGSIAHADPAGDPPVVASLLHAEIVATDVDGERVLDATSFFHGFYETMLEPDEFVTEVRFPSLKSHEGAGYAKWEPTSGAYPVAMVGAYVAMDDGVVDDARVVTGALEGGPSHMETAAEALVGAEPNSEVIEQVAEQVGTDSNPFGDFEGGKEFKQHLGSHLAKEALQDAIEWAR